MCVIIPTFHVGLVGALSDESLRSTSHEPGVREGTRGRQAVKSQSGDPFFVEMNPVNI